MEAARPRVLSAEQRAALARIEGLVEYWRITAEELDAATPAEAVAARPPTAFVKYRHPVSGDTWDGEGAQPDWLRRALLQEGYLVSELKAAASQAADLPNPG